jgi:predicted TIM-barrel fold metal-dependent hydrolase
VIRNDGSKARGVEFMEWHIDDAHRGAYDVDARLAMMDELGIWAHIVYPNSGIVGFGGSGLASVTDPELRLLCTTIYNDAMAELQEESGQRLFPMAMTPYWDIEAAVAEVRRAHALGLKGINTSSDPQNQGCPDLAERHWDPLWEVCSELGMPVNFHIGASETSSSWFGNSPWPSLDPERKLALGSSMMYLTNARVLANIIYAGILERHPSLHFVSVESGIGWLPFMLQALDYQLLETAPGSRSSLSLMPSEYFRRQIHACFWFEAQDAGLETLVESVGVDNVMFETDFPHPTCLYPESLDQAAPGLASLTPDVRTKVLSSNAAALYSVPLDETT